MNINDQVNAASSMLASATTNLGFRHPRRLAILATARILQAERKRQMKAEGFTSIIEFVRARQAQVEVSP